MKHLKNLRLTAVEHPREDYVLLKLTTTDGTPMPEMKPGQFVEVQVTGSTTTFLRRPISINFVDYESNELWLLIHVVGDGTKALSQMSAGDELNCLLPLGKGFSLPVSAESSEKGEKKAKRFLLIGGGVGTAPLLYYGKCLKEAGHQPTFLLGGRRNADILQRDLFMQYGEVGFTTEDGSMGVKGFVTNHPLMQEDFDGIATCGPLPMMKAVARCLRESGKDTPLEVSLENKMACGLGACLCCVEKNKDGHNVCVCTEGPVFNINELPWQD